MVHVVGNKKNQIKKLARGTAVPVSEMKFPTELVDLGTTSVPPSTHPDQPLDISECWKTLAVVVVAVVAVLGDCTLTSLRGYPDRTIRQRDF